MADQLVSLFEWSSSLVPDVRRRVTRAKVRVLSFALEHIFMPLLRFLQNKLQVRRRSAAALHDLAQTVLRTEFKEAFSLFVRFEPPVSLSPQG